MKVAYKIDNNKHVPEIINILLENELRFSCGKCSHNEKTVLFMNEILPLEIMNKNQLVHTGRHNSVYRDFMGLTLSFSRPENSEYLNNKTPKISLSKALTSSSQVGADFFIKSQKEIHKMMASSSQAGADLASAFMVAYVKESSLPKNKIGLDGVEFFSKNKKSTTLVNWNDNTKTAVRCSDNDFDDKEKAFLFAYFQKNSGLNKTQANKLIKEIANGKHLPTKK